MNAARHSKQALLCQIVVWTHMGRVIAMFHSLLGAMWLQMSWLFDDKTEQRRCKWCGKVILIEPGGMPRYPGLAKNVRGRYKTRKDKAFCNDRQDKSKSGCRAKYHYHYEKRPFKQLKKLPDRDAQ
jgi:hypothetical protein